MPGGMFTLPSKIVNAGKANIWNSVCRFKPAPDPIAEPTPTYEPPPEPPPPDLPPAPEPPEPGVDYDEPTLWMLVFEYLRQIKSIVERNQVLATWLADNTQTLGFSTGDSIVVSGNGGTFLSPADGYMVELLTVPDWLGHSQHGDPTYFQAGWLGIGRFPAQETRVMLTRAKQMFYPAGYEPMSVSWELATGIQARITALLRLPYPDAPPRESIGIGG